MKTSFATAAVLAGLVSCGMAAVTFSGGSGGDPLVLTLTSDLRLPVQFTGDGQSFILLLEDAYLTDQQTTWATPTTSYGSTGSITVAFEMGDGSLIEFTDYSVMGPLNGNYARIDPNDFVMTFTINPASGLVNGDDTLLIRAGSITMGPGVAVPDAAISSVMGLNPDGTDLTFILPVPEPSVALLLGVGGIPLLRRRRKD